jgi:hypothetical protein
MIRKSKGIRIIGRVLHYLGKHEDPTRRPYTKTIKTYSFRPLTISNADFPKHII